MIQIDEKMLETIIRNVVQAELSNKSANGRQVDPSGVMAIDLNHVHPEQFDTGKAGDKVFLKDIFSLEESPRLGCGLMEMDKTTFDWTLNYDEVDYIIEGQLEVIIDGRKVVGKKGDVMLIPKGSKIQFSAPDYAKFIYVVFPANWEQQNNNL